MHNVDDDGSEGRSERPEPDERAEPEAQQSEDDDTTSERFGPTSGLGAALGVFDYQAFSDHIEPLFSHEGRDHTRRAADDPERLLLLAERLLESIEGYRERGLELTAPLQHLARTSDLLLAAMESAEDAGFEGARVTQSPYAEAFLAHRDRLLLLLVQGSPLMGALLSDASAETVAELARLPTLAYSRAALRYWSLALIDPTFKGVELVALATFQERLRKATPSSPLLRLLRGAWERWPAFRPDDVLAMGAPHDPSLEDAPVFDWAVCSPESNAAIADRLPRQIRRFLHLEFLREAHPVVYNDYIMAYDPEIASELLDGYADLEAARPWSQPYEDAWRFVDGTEPSLPKPTTAVRLPLDEAAAQSQARALLGALRDALRVVRAAHARNAGLYVVFYERQPPTRPRGNQP